MSKKKKLKNTVKLFGIPINQRSVVRWKIYLDRARMYIGYISFVMIAFVFLNSFESAEIRNFLDQHKLVVYPAIMIVFILLSLVLGRLDTKLGMRKEELRNHAAENPVTMEILESLKQIKADQKKLMKKKK